MLSPIALIPVRVPAKFVGQIIASGWAAIGADTPEEMAINIVGEMAALLAGKEVYSGTFT